MFRGLGSAIVMARGILSVVAIPVVLVAPSDFVAADAPDRIPAVAVMNPLCIQAQLSVRKFPVDSTDIYDAGVVTLGTWRVPFRSQRFVAAHATDPSLTLAYHSAAWLIPDQRADISRAIVLFIEMARENPDPGSSLDLRALPGVGWSEAAITLRLKTALCLYAVAQSDAERESLSPAIDALVAAAKDEARYYGPPRMPAHNHGVMADRELLNAAIVLNRPELAEFAKRRLQAQLEGLYDSCGFTHEQSNGYQHLHASLWTQIARRVQSDPAFHARIMREIERVQNAADAVTFPHGFTPVIGNGRQKSSPDLASVNRDILLMCSETGWFSWREKGRGIQQQVIARFGPGTRFHGHADKGSVVWFAKPAAAASGVEVLSDRGLPSKSRNRAYDYAVGPTAHATLLWGGGSNLRMSGTVSRTRGGVTLEMRGSTVPGGSWKRTVITDSSQTILTLEDRLGGKAASRPAIQNFPLDPIWLGTSRPDTYRTGSGLSLVIVCTTAAGVKVPVKQLRVPDYQEDIPRRAFTASCRVPKGALGARAVIKVVPT